VLPSFCLILAAMCAPAVAAPDDRVDLFPKLRAGETIHYLVSYHSDKRVKAESTVVLAAPPEPVKLDTSVQLRLEILGVEAQNGRATSARRSVIHARAWVLSRDTDPAVQSPAGPSPESKELAVDFTILPDGGVDHVTGLDALPAADQRAWQAWTERFAAAAVFPAGGVKVGQKWKSKEPERSPSAISDLSWIRESTYVRNEPCPKTQTNVHGDYTQSSQAAETCAVILTTAALKQQSSPKNTTPEDFKLHNLRTMGTACGNNKTITYISLQTGLVVRATDDADQTMNVTIAAVDGGSRVHYDVHATSTAELLLVTGATTAKNNAP
jgi:hypothetical protein